MDAERIVKIADIIIDSALATGQHPYAIVNQLAVLLMPDKESRQQFGTDIQTELFKRSKSLPWSL